jgi:hypothetical protein
MEHLWCDAHQVWEVSPAKRYLSLLSESRAFVVDPNLGDLRFIRRDLDRRYDLWPIFSEGIVTDVEGLSSVTPCDAICAITARLDQEFQENSPIIVEACCGIGANHRC